MSCYNCYNKFKYINIQVLIIDNIVRFNLLALVILSNIENSFLSFTFFIRKVYNPCINYHRFGNHDDAYIQIETKIHHKIIYICIKYLYVIKL